MDTLIPTRPTRAADVNPGDVIVDDDRHGLVTVDAVHRVIDGYTFLGWPTHRAGTGKRVSVIASDDDIIDVVANADDATAVADALFHVVTLAAKAWHHDNDSEGAVDQEAAPFSCARHGAVVYLTVGGYRLTADLAAHAAKPDAADQPDDDDPDGDEPGG